MRVMTETKAAAITAVAPCFIVANYTAARDFYTHKLGFEVQLEIPDEDPFFGIVAHDSVSVFLKEIGPDVEPQPNHTRHEWAKWDAFVHTPDPDTLYANSPAMVSPFTRISPTRTTAFEVSRSTTRIAIRSSSAAELLTSAELGFSAPGSLDRAAVRRYSRMTVSCRATA